MEFFSHRLSFGKFESSDFEMYSNWYQDPQVTKYITGRALTEQESKKRFEMVLDDNQKHASLGWYKINLLNIGIFIGIGKLKIIDKGIVEIGYGMLPEYWHQGYGTEMIACLLDYAKPFEFITTIIAIADPDNAPSIRILKRQNFAEFKRGVDQAGRPFVEYRKQIIPS